MYEGLDWFGLIRLGGGPGGGPGTPFETRGRFFGACLFEIARGAIFFGMMDFGIGLMRFELAAWFSSRFRFAGFFFFGIVTSSYWPV